MHLDPIKDWLLVLRLTVTLGGPSIMVKALFYNNSFSSMVSH